MDRERSIIGRQTIEPVTLDVGEAGGVQAGQGFTGRVVGADQDFAGGAQDLIEDVLVMLCEACRLPSDCAQIRRVLRQLERRQLKQPLAGFLQRAVEDFINLMPNRQQGSRDRDQPQRAKTNGEQADQSPGDAPTRHGLQAPSKR